MRCILTRARLRVTDLIHFVSINVETEHIQKIHIQKPPKRTRITKRKHETQKLNCVIYVMGSKFQQKQIDLQRNILICK